MVGTPEEWLAGRIARIKREAMRDHPFVGEGKHCSHWLEHTRATEFGTLSTRVACGYPRDLHPLDP